MIVSSDWKNPFHWSWKSDDGSFEAYPDSISNLIESHYSAFKGEGGNSSFTTPPIRRYVDDIPQKYKIDFVKNKQINAKTGYRRDIERRQIEMETLFAQWQVLIDKLWTPFEFVVQGRIDRIYRMYKDNSGRGIVRGLKFPGRPESYTLDVVKGLQTNEKTGTVRQIRRIPLNRLPPSSTSSKEKIIIQLPGGISEAQINQAWKCLRGMEQQLLTIANRACNRVDGSDSIQFTFSKDNAELCLSGSMRSICAMLVGRIQAALHQHGITTGACITATGNFGASMLKNPRLLQLLTPLKPMEKWDNRDEAMLLLAHALIWEAKCTVYGGFVRDWVIRGESANDIDVLLPSESQSARNETQSRIVHAAQSMNIEFVKSKSKGKAYTLVFRGKWTGKNIEVDLVQPNINKSRPFVDSDVGNLCISEEKGLCKRYPSAGAPLLDIAKCVAHCTEKKFVILYDPVSNEGEFRQRLTKYLSRGWTCLSQLPSSLEAEMKTTFGHNLFQPDAKYSKAWWAS